MKKLLVLILIRLLISPVYLLAQNGRQSDQVIRAVDYGAIPDGRYVLDATTATSTTITCPNSDCNFINATQANGGDIGKIVFGIYNASYQGGGAMTAGVLVIPQGTITAVGGANSITVSNASTANHTANVMLVWGTDNTTALANAYKAAQPNLGPCYAIELPAGIMLDQQGQFNNAPANCIGATGLLRASTTVIGKGSGASIIGLTPNFTWSTCNGPTGGCFGDSTNVTYGFAGGTYFTGWSVIGFGYSAGGPASGGNCPTAASGVTCIFVPNDNSIFDHVYCTGIGASNNRLNGLLTSAVPVNVTDVQIDGCGGNIGMSLGGTVYISGQSYAGDTNGISLEITGGIIQSTANLWGPNLAGGTDMIYVTGGVFDSDVDNACFTSSGAGGNALHITGGVVNLRGRCLSEARSGSATVYITNGTLNLSGESVTNTGTGTSYSILNAGGIVNDNGGNVLSSSNILYSQTSGSCGGLGACFTPQPPTVVLHSNFTNSNTTFTTITDGTRPWSWTAQQLNDYKLDCTFYYQGATATTNSPNIQITGPATPTAVSYGVDGYNGTTFVSANGQAFSTSLNPFGTLASATTIYMAHISMSLSNGTTSGTVAVQAKNTTGTDVLTIYKGSGCTFQ